MLSADQLQCIRGERSLFQDLSFTLAKGALLQVEGPNGSGKTSLLRMVCGLLPPSKGVIRWNGESLREIGDEYFRHMLYLGHASAIKEELSGAENLRLATALADEPTDELAVLDALREMGLRGRETLPAKYLSQGQRRRVALARLLVSKRPLWILDEPFVALDTAAVAQLAAIIGRHVDAGGLVLLTSHQEVAVPRHSVERLRLAA